MKSRVLGAFASSVGSPAELGITLRYCQAIDISGRPYGNCLWSNYLPVFQNPLELKNPSQLNFALSHDNNFMHALSLPALVAAFMHEKSLPHGLKLRNFDSSERGEIKTLHLLAVSS